MVITAFWVTDKLMQQGQIDATPDFIYIQILYLSYEVRKLGFHSESNIAFRKPYFNEENDNYYKIIKLPDLKKRDDS